MSISLGFFVILILVIFPGLIFRRLFFYGEFSTEFKSSYNLISLISVSAIPGLINLICVFLFYDNFFVEIDLGEIIDKFKDINNPTHRLTQTNGTPIKELINFKASPFIGFLYLSSIIFGSVSGRFIRITRIDTKFKLLRFKNYWFYLFNGQHTGFKKMKHMRKKNKTHLFTKADILIDSNSNTLLYSGIVVDYELVESDCKALSKVMLQNAERYRLKDGVKSAVGIPGNLLVVDCSMIKNINLTYVYEESKSVLESKLPSLTDMAFGLITLLLIPIFIFQSESINWSIYETYFGLSWYKKIVAYILTIQVLGIINPFVKEDDEYQFVNGKTLLAKLILLIFMVLLLLWMI